MAPLGNLVRLLPLHINELPAHPALESLVSSPSKQTKSAGSSPSQAAGVDLSERPNLISFMEEIFDQASIFVDDTLPATFKEGGLKTSTPANAKVELLRRNISSAEIRAIPWINSSMYIGQEILPYFALSYQTLFRQRTAYFPLSRHVKSEFCIGIPRNWSNGRKPAEAWFARRSRQ